MADNVTILGYVIATNEIGGVHYQRIKLISGVAGELTPVPAGANGLHVDVRAGVLTDTQLRNSPVPVRPAKGTTSTVTAVAAVASPTAAAEIAANPNRLGLMIENDSTASLDIKYGAGATAALRTQRLKPGGFWEMPQPIEPGIVSLLWTAADGHANVTEQV